MATVTHVRSTGVTTNSTTYTVTAVTPTVNELLIIFASVSGTAVNGVCTDNKGGTYTLISSAVKNSSGDRINAWIGDQLVSTSSMSITRGYTGDGGTGSCFTVFSVAGLSTSRLGANASRQVAVANNQVASTPTVTFATVVASSNPTLGFVANGASPATLTQPTGWTESADYGFSTPTNGAETVFRNDTFNGTVVTWGSTSVSAYGVIMVELDTSTMAGAAGGFPGRRTLMGVGRV